MLVCGCECQPSPPGLLEVKKNPHCFSFCFRRIKYGSKKTAENTAHFKCLHVTNEGFVRARNVMQHNCAIHRVITGFIENINSSVPREVWSGDGTECKAGSRRSRASSFSGVFATSATASSRHHWPPTARSADPHPLRDSATGPLYLCPLYLRHSFLRGPHACSPTPFPF